MKIQFIDYGGPDWKKAVALRSKVLREPLGQTFTPDELEEERNHCHIAVYDNDVLVGTAVLVPENEHIKMQRVTVEETYRNLGFGAKILEFSEKWCRENQKRLIYCHARNTAVRFYSMNGYSAEGDYFDEDGIPHLKMIKRIQ